MSNHLGDQSSPYLLQHAENPVDWYPYDQTAFNKAQQEQKLIFLSIGYSACHWCHVMAHESFEDKSIAAVLNKNFVSIKVDREERPDIDIIYQNYAQIMGKGGGWPLSVFLTPSRKPFFVGTYFPPQDRYGLIGFPALLDKLIEAYQAKADEIEKSGNEILDVLGNLDKIRPANQTQSPATAQTIGKGTFLSVTRSFLAKLDFKNGGFGQAPKFPNFPSLVFLLRQASENLKHSPPSEETNSLIEGLRGSFTKMMWGGVYDHIGGGFHRYSVDAQWRVPHFEKMLYDNAMAAQAYAEAYLFFGDPEYRGVVRGTLEWLDREMKSPEGAYYSTLDADSGGKEGGHYVWTEAELAATLNPEEQALCKQYFEISPKGNFEARKSALNRKISLPQLSKQLQAPPSATQDRLKAVFQKLWARRQERPRPAKDTKIITAWNALLLKALTHALQIFRGDPFEAKVERMITDLARFLSTEVVDGETHEVARVFMGGTPRISGKLDDYAYLIAAFIPLYGLTGDPAYFKLVSGLIEKVNHEFWDAPGRSFFFAPAQQQDIPVRPRLDHDMPLPSPSSVMGENLLFWAEITGDHAYLDQLEDLVGTLYPQLKDASLGAGTFFQLLQEYLYGLQEVVIFPPAAEAPEKGQKWLRDIYHRLAAAYIPRKIFLTAPSTPGDNQLIEGKRAAAQTHSQGGGVLFICENRTCSPPLGGAEDIEAFAQTHFPQCPTQ